MSNGAKELGEMVDFVMGLATAIGKATEDKKLTIGDAQHLLPLIYDIPTAVDGIDKIPSEISQMKLEDVEAMIARAKEKLKLPDAKAEEMIEGSLDIAIRIYALVQKARS